MRPKEQKKNDIEETNDKDDIEILEPKRRKGVFFSSSIGLQCDVQRLSNDINSRISVEKTYYIEEHKEAKDPDLFLKKTIENLDEVDDIDFIILSVGSNDITKLNIEEDIKHLNEKVCEQSVTLVNIAEETSKKHNVDVFIVEKPARFDKEVKDPERRRSVLTVSSNGLLPSLITPLERVHFIPLSSLSTTADRDCFSRDGIHLTSKGEQLFLHDLVVGVKNVYSDLELESFKPQNTKRFQKDGNNKSTKTENTNSDDRRENINNRYQRTHTGGNSAYNYQEGPRNTPRDERGYRNTGRYHTNYQSHTPEQQYQRYNEPQYRQYDDRRQYRGYTHRQNRYQGQYRDRYREQTQMDGEPYFARSYQHRFGQDSPHRYYR